MSMKQKPREKMSNLAFKGMSLIFKIVDFFSSYARKRIKTFNIQKGAIIVDYGCGPGRYTIPFAGIVGDKGKVYAVDIHELALANVKKKMEKKRLGDIDLIHAKGNDDGEYSCAIPDNTADFVCAFDMFFMIKNPTLFLKELKRILKPGGTLIIDDGHQSRAVTKDKIKKAQMFKIFEETKDHLKCSIV